MYFSDSVTLRSVSTTQDADGYPVITPTDSTVFANDLSASRAEFYAANANGIDISLMVQVHVEDWSNQTQLLLYNDPVTGKAYVDDEGAPNPKLLYIKRTYLKGGGIIELSCSDKAV